MFQMETGCLCRYFHPSIHPFSAAYPIHELRAAKTYSSCQEAKVVDFETFKHDHKTCITLFSIIIILHCAHTVLSKHTFL